MAKTVEGIDEFADTDVKQAPDLPEANLGEDTGQFAQAVSETAETLISQCSEVRVRTSWFSTSVKVDKATAAEMLLASGADRKAVSISKRLMSSKHEAMQAVKDAKAAIEAHVLAWTIPMMTVRVATDTAQDDVGRKDAGIRLIQKKDMQEFDERLRYLIGLLKTAAQKLQEAMPAIKADDQAKLKKMYDENDYPADVASMIDVDVSYRQVGCDIAWKDLCPEIYEREQAAARQKFDCVVENAAVEFAKRFVQYVKQVTDQIGNRVRLNPREGKARVAILNPDGTPGTVDVTEAEVLARITHDDEPDEVPVDHLLVQLRLVKEGRGRSTDVWLAAPMLSRTFHDNLRPYESATERRKLFESTINNLRSELDTFLNIGQMLGPYETIIGDAVRKVKTMLTSVSPDLKTDRIAKELRDGEYFRNQMRDCLIGVTTSVESAMRDAKVSRRTVRRIAVEKL